MPTPHIGAQKGEIAKTVLLPGDPLRAKFIAENFLENVKQVSSVRNMFCYTGTYNGNEVSVMGSGMGMPSIGIVAHELVTEYGCENLIRVGSMGSYQENVKVRDVVIALGASTNSNFASQFELNGVFSAVASYDLLSKAVESAKELDVDYHVGNIFSSDIFYDANTEMWKKWAALNHLGVEMEAYALYVTAAKLNVNALTILTVSDHFITSEVTTAQEREQTFTKMMEIALKLA